MKRRFRLTRSSDLQRVRLSGKPVRHPLVVMLSIENEQPISHIGVIAGRSVGNAVQRNRAKRLIRHAVLPYLSQIGAGWDILFIARAHLRESTYQQVYEAIGSLLDRSGIMLTKNDIKVR